MESKKRELINSFDQIIRWPKKPSDKEVAIRFLASKFDFKKKYTEQEVNLIIKQHHLFNDIALLRRELVSRGCLDREDDGSIYWKNS